MVSVSYSFKWSVHIAYITFILYLFLPSCSLQEMVTSLQNQVLSITKSMAQRKLFSSTPKIVIQRISPELVIRLVVTRTLMSSLHVYY
jgi:hypothetical protein